MVYRSEALAQDHVSSDYPRIISFGGDGRFTFAWNTDVDAPSEFRDSVEFLRQNDDDWSAGVIDFSGASHTITEPASCQACHGSLNKPFGAGGTSGAEQSSLTRTMMISMPRLQATSA